MTPRSVRPLLAGLLALSSLLRAEQVASTTPQPVSASAGHALLVAGDSSLHAWKAWSDQVQLWTELKEGPGSLLERLEEGALQGLSLSVKTESLQSSGGAGMDKNMAQALEAAKFPGISFRMAGYELKAGAVLARGFLKIHGTEKAVELRGTLTAEGEGLRLRGSCELLMSDYGIRPPVMMLGMLRVRDKVLVRYDLGLFMKP